MRDIQDRADIELLISEFYKLITVDADIGHHFDGLDLVTHLPIITDFWEKSLFGRPVYFNNPFEIHKKLHERSPLTSEHIVRWVELFVMTMDRLFAGELAELAKSRAAAIGDAFDQRLNGGIQISRAV
jgi:hemoglobin